MSILNLCVFCPINQLSPAATELVYRVGAKQCSARNNARVHRRGRAPTRSQKDCEVRRHLRRIQKQGLRFQRARVPSSVWKSPRVQLDHREPHFRGQICVRQSTHSCFALVITTIRLLRSLSRRSVQDRGPLSHKKGHLSRWFGPCRFQAGTLPIGFPFSRAPTPPSAGCAP